MSGHDRTLKRRTNVLGCASDETLLDSLDLILIGRGAKRGDSLEIWKAGSAIASLTAPFQDAVEFIRVRHASGYATTARRR
jgi:hypothetical protein